MYKSFLPTGLTRFWSCRPDSKVAGLGPTGRRKNRTLNMIIPIAEIRWPYLHNRISYTFLCNTCMWVFVCVDTPLLYYVIVYAMLIRCFCPKTIIKSLNPCKTTSYLNLGLVCPQSHVNLINSLRPTIVVSNNGLLPGQCQAIIWTNTGILLIQTLGTNFSEILSEIHTFSLKKLHLKMWPAKWRLFHLSLNELNTERL